MMIPNQSYCFSGIVVTLYFFFLFFFVLHTLASPTLHFCRHDQRDALLEFKHELPGNRSSSPNVYTIKDYMPSWNKSNDCCSWDGVTCDAKSGKVISINLENIFLNKSLKPNSGLFKLQYLQNLSLFNCKIYGKIPSSFGKLSHLTMLDLPFNELVGQIPASIWKLNQLRYLSLFNNTLSGKIPVSIGNLTSLRYLDLSYNNFRSELPTEISRLHNLEIFNVSENSFFGPFPRFLLMIPSLQAVNLSGNEFKGPIEFGYTSLLSRLNHLYLDHNKFDGPIPESISKFPNLVSLHLGYNSFIGPIPRSISQLVNLYSLDLSNNKLEGEVPGCLQRLFQLKLSKNSFSSFGKSSQVLDQAPMRVLCLYSNSFRGSFPHWICKLRMLELVDVSNNSFSGAIPPCLKNITKSLQVLILRNNNFNGILPDIFDNATALYTLDVSRNRLEGKLSKSLINCKAMELLNVGSNRFKDMFPSWLGSLPALKVLSLRSNQFYGSLYHNNESVGFQNLKVIDLSHNDFTGTFPSLYFSNWREMSQMTTSDSYMQDSMNFLEYTASYRNSMEMVHKGVDTKFERIRKDFRAIDFSGNKFCGKIPESIGLLKELILLNLSGNTFTSKIPQSLANLTKLEALDLSRNKLLGQIPPDLGSLSFLSTMDFSHNNLEGPIPQGTQFQRQNCSSFMDNPRLYGLGEICEKTHVQNSTPQESKDVSEPEEQVINWIAAAIAYGPGVFCGLVIGHIFVSQKHQWFMKKFHRNKATKKSSVVLVEDLQLSPF